MNKLKLVGLNPSLNSETNKIEIENPIKYENSNKYIQKIITIDKINKSDITDIEKFKHDIIEEYAKEFGTSPNDIRIAIE